MVRWYVQVLYFNAPECVWNCNGWLVYIGVQPDLEDSDAMFGYRLGLVIRTTGDGEKKPSV